MVALFEDNLWKLAVIYNVIYYVIYYVIYNVIYYVIYSGCDDLFGNQKRLELSVLTFFSRTCSVVFVLIFTFIFFQIYVLYLLHIQCNMVV